MVRLFDVKTGAEVGSSKLRSPITTLAFQPGGKYLAVGMADKRGTVALVEYAKLVKKAAP